MNTKSFAAPLALLLPLLGACRSAPVDEPAPARQAAPAEAASERAPEETGARVTEASWSNASASAPAPRAAVTGQSPLALSFWNDPRFERWFLASYAAETEIEPSVTASERDRLEEVLEKMADDEMDEAAKLLEKARGDSASAVIDFTLANIRFQQERFEEAATALEVAVDKYPKFRRAWQNLGIVRFRDGDYERALEALTHVIELGGANAVTYGMLGFAYSSTGNYLSAESAYRMALLFDPATTDWKQGLSFCLFKQGRFAETAALCDAMIAERSDRADLWMLQANAYLGLGKVDEAAQDYEMIDRLGASTAESLDKLGDIYASQELYDLALGAYERALDAKADGAAGRGIRAAKILASRGALDETGELLAKIEALQGAPLPPEQQKDVLRLKARVAVAQGADDEQVAVLEQIVELDPTDGQALILLAQHWERSSDPEKATFYYQRAMNLEKFEADANLGLAQLLVRQTKYAEALPYLRRAQQLDDRENVRSFLEQVERYAGTR